MYSFVLNFERDFDTVRVLGKGKRYDNKRKVIYDEKFEEFLRSKACLKRWAHMPIGSRVMRIRKVKGIEVTSYRLRAFYKLHKVTYKRAYHLKMQEFEQQPRLRIERRTFSGVIKSIWEKGLPHIYFDESVSGPSELSNNTFVTVGHELLDHLEESMVSTGREPADSTPKSERLVSP